MPELIAIEPNEIKFLFELKKQLSCPLRLINTGDDFVAFKVKTTAPRKYCVRPNSGVLQPRSSCDVTFTMQAQRETPPDYVSKDKFLIQTTKTEKVVETTFDKNLNNEITETKLKVLYVPAEAPETPTTSTTTTTTEGSPGAATGPPDTRYRQHPEEGKVESKSFPGKVSGSTSGHPSPSSSSSPHFTLLLLLVSALLVALVAYVMNNHYSWE